MSEFNLQVNTEKFNAIRRKLSFDCNQDLTNEEVLNYLIENAYNNSVPKKRNRVSMNTIIEQVQNGMSTAEVAKNLNVSMSTVFRAKRLAK